MDRFAWMKRCSDSGQTNVLEDTGGDKLVSWSSKKQDYTSMSSAEAEYASLSAYCAQVLCIASKWFKSRTKTSTDVPTADMIVMTSMIELESLFYPLFDEYFNEENTVVSKSSAVTTADASDKRQQQPDSTSYTSTLATTVTADGNFDLYIFLYFSLF
ncbi:hypothetical protein Tco_0791218 [Tanacetum coccineum]